MNLAFPERELYAILRALALGARIEFEIALEAAYELGETLCRIDVAPKASSPVQALRHPPDEALHPVENDTLWKKFTQSLDEMLEQHSVVLGRRLGVTGEYPS